MRNKDTIEFLGLLEKINNPNFKPVEFDGFRNEADLLNMALFSMTAKEWREKNPDKDGNIRDYASLEQLLILANLENLNSEYIKAGIEQKDRLINLNRVAIDQMKILTNQKTIEGLKKIEN